MSDERPPSRVGPVDPVGDADAVAGASPDASAHPDDQAGESGQSRHLLAHEHVGDQAHPIVAARPAEEDHVAPGPSAARSGEPVPGPGNDDIRAGTEAGRPLIERLGMAAIALVLAALFGAVAVAAFSGGELFLAAMGAIGCGMTIWVGALTLFRG